MNFSWPFIRRPIGTTLLAIGMFLVGAVAYVPAGRQPAERRVSRPSASVANRPGADPDTMAATVAAPLERRLGEIAGVTELTSASSLGTTRITVQFDLSRNIDGAARDVQAALNAAAQPTCPATCRRCPTFRKANPAAAPILILALTSKTMSPSADLRRRRYRDRPAPVAGRRRRRGQVDRRRAAGDPGAGRSGARSPPWASAIEDVRTRHRQRQRGRPARRASTATRSRDHRHQRSDARRRRVPIRSWSRPSNGTVDPPRRRRHDRARRAQHASPPAGSTASPSVLLIITKQANANVIDTVDRI